MGININQLATQINNELRRYANAVHEDVQKAAEELAKEGVATLRANSPKRTGSYAKGWKARKLRGKWIIHNATDYQLTHLLEKGHALPSGGRTQPQPHIKPVEDEIVEKFVQRVEDIASGN